MLYQLSYSPKELDDLANGFCGYSSAVWAEADVYPIALIVARVFRKNKGLQATRRQVEICQRRPRS